jgi:hypothetical protein
VRIIVDEIASTIISSLASHTSKAGYLEDMLEDGDVAYWRVSHMHNFTPLGSLLGPYVAFASSSPTMMVMGWSLDPHGMLGHREIIVYSFSLSLELISTLEFTSVEHDLVGF